MTKAFPTHPAHPERICWGCDRYCPADKLMCGNGSVATLHPAELFGEDWLSWGLDAKKPDEKEPGAIPPPAPLNAPADTLSVNSEGSVKAPDAPACPGSD